MNEPLVTVIVPVYNGEKYINDCIDSILKQEYSNIELILVDDGSTDNSYNLLEKWLKKDKRINVLHQNNAGVSVARNNGIDKAKGEFITFVDVDDYIEKDYISYFYKLIKKFDADIALTPMPNKFEGKYAKIDEKINDEIKIWNGEKATCEMLYYNIAIGPWNKLISKKLIDKFNIRFNPKLSYGEGFNFSVDCFQRAKKIAVGKRKIYNYRVDNPNSAMTKFKLKLVTGSIEAIECIKKNLVNKTEELINACRYANWHTHYDCLNTIIGCNAINQNKEIYKRIKRVCRIDSYYAFKVPIPIKEKIKAILYFLNPYWTARLINHFRLRKFTVE